jgi:hypothetical protein
MVAVMRGIVRDGKIIPDRPLPEGETVEIGLLTNSSTSTKEMQEEFDAWAQGSNDALATVETMLDLEPGHASR